MRIASTALLAGLLFAPAVSAQLLKNISTVPQPTPAFPMDSAPVDFLVVGSRVYFTAVTGPTGRELFSLDGSGAPAQLVADIASGSASSDPRDLVVLPNGLLVFTAETLALGREVWVSDGTAAGTTLLVDLTGLGESTSPQNLVVHQGNAYFLARSTGNYSLGLWRTDGTTAGTVQIESLGLTGSYVSAAQMLVSTGSMLFYTASESVAVGPLPGVWRLYTSDGTAGNAALLGQVSELFWYGPRSLTAVGSRVVFAARSPGTGLEPWVSDGTVAGTVAVDLIPSGNGSGPTEFTLVGSNVFFSAFVAGNAGEIFVTDGTSAGTVQVSNSTSDFYRPSSLRALHNQLAYVANDGVHGSELWTCNATPGSEVMIADFMPGILGGWPAEMVPFAGGILCVANTPGAGRELCFVGSAPGSISVVQDAIPGTDSADPSELTLFGSGIVFTGNDATFGREPWLSDGTALGTQLHTDLADTPSDRGSSPTGFANVGNRVVFGADDGVTGKELWSSDGTSAGTVQLTDFNGSDGSLPSSPMMTESFNGRALLRLDDGVHGLELWTTDGTSAGTHILADISPGQNASTPLPMAVFKGEHYFTADLGWFGTRGLYATDGTTAGTRAVATFPASGSWVDGQQGVVHDDRLYFVARTPAAGTELWSTDGTAAGTSMVADVFPGVNSSINDLEGASLGGYLYFAATDVLNNTELWRTDGTAGGTTLFAELHATLGSSPTNFHKIDQSIVFVVYVNGQRQYFGTDGVTIEQLSFPPLFVNWNWTLTSNGQQLIGMLRGTNGSFNLWGTDGTAAGSGVIKQIHPDGTQFVNLLAWRVSSGPKVLFLAGDSTVGKEIFVTDGTQAGTGVLFDLVPGAAPSFPGQLIRLGDSLLFSAYEPLTSYELYRLPWTLVNDWLAEPFGLGCADASGRVPAFATTGSAQPGSTLFVELTEAAPLAPVLHFWSTEYALLDLGPCSAFLATPTFVFGDVATAGGVSVLQVNIPNAPSLVGVGVWLQSLVVDPGGEFLGLGALSPAMEVRVGN